MSALQYPEDRGLRRLSVRRPARHRLSRKGEQGFATHDVDFFLGRNYLVTVHDGHSRSIDELRDHVPAQPRRSWARARSRCSTASSTRWSITIGPRSSKLEERIDELEDAVFERPEPGAGPADPRPRSATSRRCGGSSTPQRDVIGRLARREFVDISTEMSFRFRDVYDHLVRLTDEAMMLQDRITGMLDAHLSNVSNRLNEVMKVLTVVSTIFMPLTLLSGIWGMNVPLPHFPGRRGGAVLVGLRHHAGARRRHADAVRRQALDLTPSASLIAWARSPGCLRISRTRSPPAKSSSGRRPSSRSWSRTPSTPARGGSSIHVELGGKKQVRVEDDGEGMEPEDARLAIERHATSKIRRADDLAAILTLGFRGEALPSIASVSHFVLRTRARGRQSGTEIRVNGGDDRVGRRGGRRRRHRRRGQRSLLQPAGAAQVPEVRRRRVRAGVAHHHAAGAGLSRRSASR